MSPKDEPLVGIPGNKTTKLIFNSSTYVFNQVRQDMYYFDSAKILGKLYCISQNAYPASCTL